MHEKYSEYPKVSIITVCYNSEQTIQDTFESIQNQTYSKIEHILVDGGSKDSTMEIIKKYEASSSLIEVRYVSERDRGLYDAMNKGVALASGDIIGILNSDDVLEDQTTIADIVKKLKETNRDGVYGDVVFTDFSDLQKVSRIWKSRVGDFAKGWIFPHPTMYLRKEVYEEIGKYRPEFKISSDYDFILRAFWKRDFKLEYMNQTLVRMRNGGESTRNLKSNYIGFREAQIALNEVGMPRPFLTNIKRILRKIDQLKH